MSLASLFFRQFEEYRHPGHSPGMINYVFFSSKQSDRYPLNTNSALAVNLATGWVAYLLAAVSYKEVPWLAIAVTMIMVGNFVIHTFVFNIKGSTIRGWRLASFFSCRYLSTSSIWLP